MLLFVCLFLVVCLFVVFVVVVVVVFLRYNLGRLTEEVAFHRCLSMRAGFIVDGIATDVSLKKFLHTDLFLSGQVLQWTVSQWTARSCSVRMCFYLGRL